ncbi:MAG: hypothetical protein WA160_16180, partial [Pseudobdellovibrio sp.]
SRSCNSLDPTYATGWIPFGEILHLPKDSSLSVFDLSSPARSILETLAARRDVLIVIAPMTDNTGVVLSDNTEPEMFASFRKQFASLPQIADVKILYVLGDKATPLTAIHENRHVRDLTEGRLPLPKMRLEALIVDLDQLIKTSNDPVTDEDMTLIRDWIEGVTRSSPEIAALQTEFQYLRKTNSYSKSFLEYLKASPHDFIGKKNGIFWINQNLKTSAAKKSFFKTVAPRVCVFIRETFKDLLLQDVYPQVYTSCLKLAAVPFARNEKKKIHQ